VNNQKRTNKIDSYDFTSTEEDEFYGARYYSLRSPAESDLSGKTYLTTTQIGDDIVVTDVTSGIVTVTIKECTSSEGFFKKREDNFKPDDEQA
jgi:hypothetical protein